MTNVRRIVKKGLRALRKLSHDATILSVIAATLFYSFGGLDLYLGIATPFAPKQAGAAYTGKQLHTVEYILGGGSDNTVRATGVLAYAGNSWNTTKGSAGSKKVVLEGSNIAVKNAYLEVGFEIGSSVNLSNIGVVMDVAGGVASGTDVRIAEELDNSAYQGTGLTGYIRSVHDATALFQTQTDSQWHTGMAVIAGVQADFSAASNRILTSAKLVITYENDYSSIAHNEIKTVRFPLSSNNGTDTGTRQAQCGALSTCGFTYTADIPDATSDADILDVHFELHGGVDSALASTLTPQISGGTAGPAYAWNETNADKTTVNIFYVPPVGAPDFTRNTAQTLNITTGTVQTGLLGGELVVTYRYSTGAARQTETIRYFIGQQTTNPGTATTTVGTTTATISNSGFQVKNIWYRARLPAIAATNLNIASQVGTATIKIRTYNMTGTNPRAGDTPTIIHDISADKGNFFASQAALGAFTRSSVTNAPIGIEAYVTFTWDGTPNSPVTKSVSFSAAQQGVGTTLGQYSNRPAYLTLSETVTKTYRDAYLEMMYTHSRAATTISLGTVTFGVNASTSVITENGDTEAFHTSYFGDIASTTFSQGDTISWTERTLEVHETRSVSATNYFFFSNVIVATYDADFSATQATAGTKQLRTVEYDLAGGSDATLRVDAVTSYGGSSWSTTKSGAGKKNVVISGTGIQVKNAYLEVSFGINISTNINNIAVLFDADNTTSSGSDANVAEELDVNAYIGSGVSGYIRSVHDVTAFLQQQSDSQWNSGVGVVAGVNVDFSGATANRYLTDVKLVVTYASDYSLVPHTETKTVRFPLDSTTGTDTGTKQTACAISAICSFTFTSDLPDAAADADILDVYVDLHAEVDSNAASNFDFQLDTMTNPSALYGWSETISDDHSVDVRWHPTVGGTGFARNTTQRLDIGNNAVALNALGGEVVVTYRYSTGSTAQTETVSYYLQQESASSGAVRDNFATITPTISNGTRNVKDIWYKIRLSPVAATNFTVFGRVGTSTEKSNVYTIAASRPRSGNSPTIIYNLSADTGNFWTSTTTLAGASLFSVAGSASVVGVEAFITFTWNGSLGGTTTRTALFSAAQQGVGNIANQWNNRPAYLNLPETVTKTYRDAYIKALFTHSNATSIAVGTLTIGANAASSSITETADATSEDYSGEYFWRISSSTLSQGNTIAWTARTLEINETKSQSNTLYFSNIVSITYDAAQEYKYPKFFQNYYRFYVDNNAITPTDPWPAGAVDLGENTEITAADSPIGNGANVRIRMSLTVATTTMLASSTQFKLQYGQRSTTCGAISSWNDIGSPGSGSIWRGFNGTPADGSNVSTSTPAPGQLLLSVSDRAGLYSESNPTIQNPFATFVGEDVEYDWNVQNNNAATDTPYCFRMVGSDGTPLDAYNTYPTARTAGYTAESRNWRWYDDENNETPTSPMALENVAPSNVVNANIIKLRVTLNETQGSDGVDQKFMLQYSEWSDFSRGVYDLVSTTTCAASSIWCYGDGVDTDDAAISTLLLTDSAAKGRHNEAATTSSSMHPLASTATEFEFTIKHAGARVNTTYYFRVYDVNHARPVPLASGKSYPSLATQGATLTFGVSGLASSTVTGGVTTDVDAFATTIPFGTVSVGPTGVIAAQRLSVSTDATEGYQVFVKTNANMVDQFGNRIPDVTGTNASPSAWATGCATSATGCFGYHSTDGTLSGGSIRFLVDDTYAKFSSTTLEEIMYNSGPVTADTADVLYRLEAHDTQPAGTYTTSAQYMVVPIF